MRFASFERDGRSTWGGVTHKGVTDLGARMPGCATLLEALRAGRLAEAEAAAGRAGADYELAEVRLLKPIAAPEKFICVGLNYVGRSAEYVEASDTPKHPSLFHRTPGSLVAHAEKILRPPESEQFDYEGEIALIIGKAGRRIPADRAREHIAGLSLCNEGSVRDWMRHGTLNVTQGKNFERSGSFGPWLVTADEFARFDDLAVQTTVNGEIRQADTTARLLFPFAELVAYISTFTELKPGDVISTGTPNGAGARFKPPKWLKPGDFVEVSCPGIGALSNEVADETA